MTLPAGRVRGVQKLPGQVRSGRIGSGWVESGGPLNLTVGSDRVSRFSNVMGRVGSGRVAGSHTDSIRPARGDSTDPWKPGRVESGGSLNLTVGSDWVSRFSNLTGWVGSGRVGWSHIDPIRPARGDATDSWKPLKTMTSPRPPAVFDDTQLLFAVVDRFARIVHRSYSYDGALRAAH